MTDRPAQAPLPPPLVMMQLLFGKQLTYSLSGVARLGVADHMDGTAKPVEDIAARCGAHAPSLYRVMRMLAGLRRVQGGAAAPFRSDARRRAAQDRRAGLSALHGDDVRRGVLHARL